MKIPLIYGFVMSLAGAMLSMLMYFTGMHDTVEKMKASQWVGIVGGLVISIGCLALAMREKRATTAAARDREWTYGSAFGTGVLTALWGALFGAIFTYAFLAFVNTNMSEVILQMQQAGMEEKGLSPSQIANAEPMMRKMMTPLILTIFQTFFGFLWAVCLSLIVAIFFRKAPIAPAAEGEMPPIVG